MDNAVVATAVPMKGGRQFMLDKCLEFFQENGGMVVPVIIKTDQQPRIKHLVEGMVRGRPEGRTVVEESRSREWLDRMPELIG